VAGSDPLGCRQSSTLIPNDGLALTALWQSFGQLSTARALARRRAKEASRYHHDRAGVSHGLRTPSRGAATGCPASLPHCTERFGQRELVDLHCEEWNRLWSGKTQRQIRPPILFGVYLDPTLGDLESASICSCRVRPSMPARRISAAEPRFSATQSMISDSKISVKHLAYPGI
jgi:hypothetical protein